jgi:hypothetical protein
MAGIAANATAEIERLQPYHAGNDYTKNTLWILNDLSNINKHRRILITELTVDLVRFDRITGEVLRADAQIPTVTKGEMEVDEDFVASIAFNEGIVKGIEISQVLGDIARYVGDDVLPRFERFFS